MLIKDVISVEEVNHHIHNFSRGDTQVYEMFENYIKHFLSLIGYEGFHYETEGKNGKYVSFEQKKKYLLERVLKEIYKTSGHKMKNKKPLSLMFADPSFSWAYLAVMDCFLLIFSKYFHMKEFHHVISRGEEPFLLEHYSEIFGHDGFNYETVFSQIEPFISSPISKTITQPQNRSICPYCKSRYNYDEFTSCPQCGA